MADFNIVSILYRRKSIKEYPIYGQAKGETSYCGLCNQLTNLISAICIALEDEKKYVIVDFFGASMHDTLIPIDMILNMEETNKNLFNKNIDITLVDRVTCDDKIKILSARNGLADNENMSADVMNEFSILWKGSSTLLNVDNLNIYFPIPYPQFKTSILFLSLNIHGVTRKFAINVADKKRFFNLETLKLDKWQNIENDLLWNFWRHPEFPSISTFDYIAKCFIFNDCFIKAADHIRNLYKIDENTLFIHCRVEQDWIRHLCGDGAKYMMQQYINMIYNIKTTHPNISKVYISSGYLDDDFIGLLDVINCVKIIYINPNDKKNIIKQYTDISGSNINALIDYIVGVNCKGILLSYNASSFSRWLGYSGIFTHIYNIPPVSGPGGL